MFAGMAKGKEMHFSNQLRSMVYASLMSALIAVGAFVSIPIGPVPIVMQNLFVLLAGLLLGGNRAAAAVGIYLLAGACGLPVFAGGTGGLGRLLGPTGGYLFGFLAAAYLVGKAAEHSRGRLIPELMAMVAASLIVYLFGVPWLKFVTGMDWQKAVAVGMVPFLAGDAVKIAAARAVAGSLRPILSLQPVPPREEKVG